MIVGHQKQWNFLKNKFEQNQLSHAYLFVGPSEVGKKRFSLDLIKLINCVDGKIEPAFAEAMAGKGECQNCRMIEELKHPDLLIVKPKDGSASKSIGGQTGASGSGEIQISQIREIQQFLSLKPYYTSFKVVMIDEAEKMNQEAQSCFLKTLEEPRGKTLLILISSKPEMLLLTIFSRCQIVKFFSVSQKEIQNYLIGKGLPIKQAETIASISEGKPGRAIKLLDEKELEREKGILKEILEICGSDFASKFQYVKNLSEENFLATLSVFKRYIRYILFSKLDINNQFPLDYLLEIPDKFKTMPISKIKQILKLIEKIDFHILTTNVNPRLALEILLMEI